MDRWTFEVIYDAARESRTPAWVWILACAIPVLLGIVFLARPRWFVNAPVRVISLRGVGAAVAFFSLLGMGTAALEDARHREFRERLARGRYVPVEGVVSGIIPGDPGGHRAEVWTVEGPTGTRRFSFRHSHGAMGYGEVRGPVRRGHYVRIADVDGRIARLEIAR